MEGQSASFDDQDGVNTSFIKNHERGGEKSDEIAVMIETSKPLPASSPKLPCIYKVSDHIRKSNELEAYTPQVISIGPFHRNNPNLQTMESFKQRYLKSFQEEADDPEMNLEVLKSAIKGAEESVRNYYSETITLGSDDFVNMIRLDAIFIIMYFLKNKLKNWTENEREILNLWLCNRMQMDFILLENQLPFFIIELIYDTAFPSRLKEGHPFIELCFRQFEYYNVQNFRHSGQSEQILHFTDLVRNFCLPPPERRPAGERSSETMKKMQSAAQLDEVGLKFKKRESSNIYLSPLELKYEDGVLEIPPFQLDSTTEIYARNLVAFEECHYPQDPYLTDYYMLLSMLIKTVKDMDVLVRKQIIDNWLEGVVATSMINKLRENRFNPYYMNSHYVRMAGELGNFYDNPPKLEALRRALFRSRLIGTATISGSVVLLLTVVQSVCSLLSLKYFYVCLSVIFKYFKAC